MRPDVLPRPIGLRSIEWAPGSSSSRACELIRKTELSRTGPRWVSFARAERDGSFTGTHNSLVDFLGLQAASKKAKVIEDFLKLASVADHFHYDKLEDFGDDSTIFYWVRGRWSHSFEASEDPRYVTWRCIPGRRCPKDRWPALVEFLDDAGRQVGHGSWIKNREEHKFWSGWTSLLLIVISRTTSSHFCCCPGTRLSNALLLAFRR